MPQKLHWQPFFQSKILICHMKSVFTSWKPALPFKLAAGGVCWWTVLTLAHVVCGEVGWTLSVTTSEVMTALDFLFCALSSVFAKILDHATPPRIWKIIKYLILGILISCKCKRDRKICCQFSVDVVRLLITSQICVSSCNHQKLVWLCFFLCGAYCSLFFFSCLAANVAFLHDRTFLCCLLSDM